MAEQILTLCLGFDRGNERTNVCCMDFQGRKWEIEDSSMIAVLKSGRNDRLNKGARVSDDTETSNQMIVEYNGTTYILGKSAMEGTKSATSDLGDRLRYAEERTRVSLLGFAARMLLLKHHTSTRVNLKVVTNVPIDTWTTENEDLIKENLNGDHSFTYNEVAYQFHVEVLEVKMEGFGGAVLHGKKGKELSLYLDGGSLTHNALAYRGLKAITEQCESTDIGVSNIAEKVNEQVLQMYKRELTFIEMEDLLWSYARITREYEDFLKKASILTVAQQYPERIKLSTTPINRVPGEVIKMQTPVLLSFVENAIKEIGKNLRTFLRRVWSSNKTGGVAIDAQSIYYFGGASYYLKGEVEQLLGEVIVPDLPQRVNAHGEAARAVSLILRRQNQTEITRLGA